eukprot:1013497-Rhodomonas_salina.1
MIVGYPVPRTQEEKSESQPPVAAVPLQWSESRLETNCVPMPLPGYPEFTGKRSQFGPGIMRFLF